MPHNERIHDVVQLLKNVPCRKGKDKPQKGSGNISPCHIAFHLKIPPIHLSGQVIDNQFRRCTEYIPAKLFLIFIQFFLIRKLFDGICIGHV